MSLLTFALALILHIQVWVAFALSLQQHALIFVGLSIRAAHRTLPGDVGAVRCTDTARLTPSVHLAPLSGPTVNVVTRFWKST